MRRFSIVGWGTNSTSPSGSPRSSVEFSSNSAANSEHKAPELTQEVSPLKPQSTGGLWSSWWASSGGEKGAQAKENDKTASWYVDGLRSGKLDMKLVKHLISLRVHLSTASLAWIEEFVSELKGLEALRKLLFGLVAKGGKRKKLQEIEGTVLLEVIKCVRVLLNTDVRSSFEYSCSLQLITVSQPGFQQGISDVSLITHIVYSLHGASTKLRALASDVLGAICFISPNEGHKTVLAAMSDYRVEFQEPFRFQELIWSLRLADAHDEDVPDHVGYLDDEEGVWEARTATMALVNAVTNFPNSLEERVLLREELTRRGLNEVIVVCRFCPQKIFSLNTVFSR